jgi:hypothetical protein
LIRTYIEAAINLHNQANYVSALDNLENAKKEWVKVEDKDLNDTNLLFFEYSKASIFASAGRDDHALYYYL